jgi:hypothetical protein
VLIIQSVYLLAEHGRNERQVEIRLIYTEELQSVIYITVSVLVEYPLSQKNIVTCMCVTIEGFRIIEFIDHLQVVLQTTITLSLFPHFTVHCYTLVYSVSYSNVRFLATVFNKEL